MIDIKDRLAENEKELPTWSIYRDARIEIERLEADNKRLREVLASPCADGTGSCCLIWMALVNANDHIDDLGADNKRLREKLAEAGWNDWVDSKGGRLG